MQSTPGKLATIGSILILIGTSVGAGMLALPLASAELSFNAALIILIIAWLVMTANRSANAGSKYNTASTSQSL